MNEISWETGKSAILAVLRYIIISTMDNSVPEIRRDIFRHGYRFSHFLVRQFKKETSQISYIWILHQRRCLSSHVFCWFSFTFFFISLNFYFFFFIFWLIIRYDVDCTIFLYKWPSYHWLSTDAIPTCMVFIYLTRVMYFTQPWR